MRKKVLAIDIDEVIRSKWLQFDRFYAQEFNEDGIKTPFDTYNLRNHYEFTDKINDVNYLNEDLPDDISPTEYQLDENGVAPVDHMAFRKKEEKITADEAFNKFLYEDYLIEIFASAPALYRGLDIHLKEFKMALQDYVSIAIFSKEQNPSISPTLFFLSKQRPTIRNYFFPESNEEVWEKSDIVITSDPDIISIAPDYKIVVKVNRPHNVFNSGDFNVSNFIDLLENNEFRKSIGAPDYVKPEEFKLPEQTNNIIE